MSIKPTTSSQNELLKKAHQEAQARRNVQTPSVLRSSIPVLSSYPQTGQVSYANQFLKDIHFEARAKRTNIPYPPTRVPSTARPTITTLRDLQERNNIQERFFSQLVRPLPPLPRGRPITLEDLEERSRLEASCRIGRPIEDVAEQFLTEAFLQRRPKNAREALQRYRSITIGNDIAICMRREDGKSFYHRTRAGAISELLQKIEENDRAGAQKVAMEIADGLLATQPHGVFVIDLRDNCYLNIKEPPHEIPTVFKNIDSYSILNTLDLRGIFVGQVRSNFSELHTCTDIYPCDYRTFHSIWHSTGENGDTDRSAKSISGEFYECINEAPLILCRAEENISTTEERSHILEELGIDKTKKPLLHAFGMALLAECNTIKTSTPISSTSRLDTSYEHKGS